MKSATKNSKFWDLRCEAPVQTWASPSPKHHTLVPSQWPMVQRLQCGSTSYLNRHSGLLSPHTLEDSICKTLPKHVIYHCKPSASKLSLAWRAYFARTIRAGPMTAEGAIQAKWVCNNAWAIAQGISMELCAFMSAFAVVALAGVEEPAARGACPERLL